MSRPRHYSHSYCTSQRQAKRFDFQSEACEQGHLHLKHDFHWLFDYAVNVVSTLVAIIGVDRVGRRFLFIASGIVMVMCEITVGVCLGYYFHNNHGVLPDNVSNGVLAVICIYVANFAWSWGELLAENALSREASKHIFSALWGFD